MKIYNAMSIIRGLSGSEIELLLTAAFNLRRKFQPQ
jgi:hypothetical protein